MIAVAPVTAKAVVERGDAKDLGAYSDSEQDKSEDEFMDGALKVVCSPDRFNAELLLRVLDWFLGDTSDRLKVVEAQLTDLGGKFHHNADGSLITDGLEEAIIATKMRVTEVRVKDVKRAVDDYSKLTAKMRSALGVVKSPDERLILESALLESCETSVRFGVDTSWYTEYLRQNVEKLHRDLGALRTKTSR